MATYCRYCSKKLVLCQTCNCGKHFIDTKKSKKNLKKI